MGPYLHNGSDAHSYLFLLLQLWASRLKRYIGANGFEFRKVQPLSLDVLWQLLSRGRDWSSGFEWGSNFVQCLILLWWMTSCTVGIPRSLWIISLVTYRGASTVALDILD